MDEKTSDSEVAAMIVFEGTAARAAFEKQLVGLAEAMFAGTDCGSLHNGNWRLPCHVCIEKERTITRLITEAISDEGSRRHMAAGHDARDGNRPKTKFTRCNKCGWTAGPTAQRCDSTLSSSRLQGGQCEGTMVPIP